MTGENRRVARVRERLREELSNVLAREIRDPRVAHVVITRVEIPGDLQLAHVFVRLAIGGDDTAARKTLLKGLKAATGKLRREVGHALGLRYAPELRFAYDEQQDDVMRIESLLREIAEEPKKE